MFCGKCGARLPEDAVACDKCGAPVRIRPEAAEYMENKEKTSGKTSEKTSEKTTEGGQSATSRKVKNNGRKNGNSSGSHRKKNRHPEGNKTSRGQENRNAENHTRRKKQAPAEEHEQPRRRTVPAAEEPARRQPAPKPVKTALVERPVYEDMDAYLASLPMQEQLRRRIAQIRHRREEAAEARRMQTHLDRAARYYETEPDSAAGAPAVMPFSALSRALSRIPTEAQSTEPEEVPDTDPSLIEEEISREREAKTRARIEKSENGRTSFAEQRKTEKAPLHPAPEDVCPQEPAGKQDRPLTEAGPAPKDARPAQAPQAVMAEEPETAEEETAAEAAGSAESQPEAAQTQQAVMVKEPETAEEEPVAKAVASAESQLEAAQAPQTAMAEEPETAEEETAAEPAGPAESQPEAEQVTRTAAAREPETVEEPLDRSADTAAAAASAAESAEQAEWIEQETRRRVQQALAEQAERARRQSREQRIEDARLLKRYREDMPDQIDETLGRYGLSKDAAVRLGTLLLIVILSVIYVAGRGRQPAVDTTVPRAGEGATGTPAFHQTEEEGTEDAGEIPAVGGDLDSAGSGEEAEQ